MSQNARALDERGGCISTPARAAPRETGPVWPDHPRFRKKLDVLNGLSQRRHDNNECIFFRSLGRTKQVCQQSAPQLTLPSWSVENPHCLFSWRDQPREAWPVPSNGASLPAGAAFLILSGLHTGKLSRLEPVCLEQRKEPSPWEAHVFGTLNASALGKTFLNLLKHRCERRGEVSVWQTRHPGKETV